MLQDDNGAIVQGIKEANMGNPVKITEVILIQWLDGVGERPTWNQLVKGLRHSDLNVLAQDVEKSLI